ncbi:MAG: LuxR family transcriptional regulator [Pseudomonadota bacterium]
MTKQAQVSLEGLTEFMDCARRSETADDLRELLVDYFTGVGMAMMSYHHLPPLGAVDRSPHITVTAHGFPPDWVKRYETEFQLIDPIPRHASHATHGFFWSDARSFEDLTEDERYYLDELDKESLGDGLAIPVFGPFGRGGYVGLGFGSGEPRPPPSSVNLFQSVCQFGHQEFCRILFLKDSAATLSPREIEILCWVSQGKSNAAIAQILSISVHTVDTHLRRIFEKLNVKDRITAALRGSALGLL